MSSNATAKTKPRRRTEPKEVRQTQLIEATIACIAEKGIVGTTMAEVTGRAGLSVGIVSLHFSNKDNLLTSTLTFLSEEVRATWAETLEEPGLTDAEKLRRVAMASFDPAIFTPTKVAVWFAFFGEARYRDFYREMVEGFDLERDSVLAGLCQTLIDANPGDTRKGKALADSIEALSDGLWLNAIIYTESFTEAYCVAQMTNLLAALFPDHFEQLAVPLKRDRSS